MTAPQKSDKRCHTCGHFSKFDWHKIKEHLLRDPEIAVAIKEFASIYSMPVSGRCRAEGSTRPKDDWCGKWIPETGDKPMWPMNNDELLTGFPFVVPKESNDEC